MPGPSRRPVSRHLREQRRRGFEKMVDRYGKKKGRFGGFPRGYKAPYKGADPRRGTVE